MRRRSSSARGSSAAPPCRASADRGHRRPPWRPRRTPRRPRRRVAPPARPPGTALVRRARRRRAARRGSRIFGGPAGPAAAASDYGLGAASQLGLTGEIDDAGARRSITPAEAQARLGELAASRAARAPKTVLPTQGRLTTCFCMRWGQMHWGIDLAAPLGTPIYAATDGVVLRAGPATGFGNAVYIQDADGNVQIYGHMRYYPSRRRRRDAGDQIAKVGSQGQSTGPHLHYEIHRGGMQGRPTDPQNWLAQHGVEV